MDMERGEDVSLPTPESSLHSTQPFCGNFMSLVAALLQLQIATQTTFYSNNGTGTSVIGNLVISRCVTHTNTFISRTVLIRRFHRASSSQQPHDPGQLSLECF